MNEKLNWKAAQTFREWIIAMQAFEDLHVLLLGGGVVLGFKELRELMEKHCSHYGELLERQD